MSTRHIDHLAILGSVWSVSKGNKADVVQVVLFLTHLSPCLCSNLCWGLWLSPFSGMGPLCPAPWLFYYPRPTAIVISNTHPTGPEEARNVPVKRVDFPVWRKYRHLFLNSDADNYCFSKKSDICTFSNISCWLYVSSYLGWVLDGISHTLI